MWWGHGLRYGDFAGFIGIYVGVTGKEMEIKFVFGSISFCFKKSSYTALENSSSPQLNSLKVASTEAHAALKSGLKLNLDIALSQTH